MKEKLTKAQEKSITVGELRRILSYYNELHDNDQVKVLTALPSIGARSYSLVTNASFGFDWDKGLLLRTEHRLVPKNKKQDIYEQAHELLMFLATEGLIKKRKRYENRQSEKILIRNGLSADDLKKYVKLFHRDKEIINEVEES